MSELRYDGIGGGMGIWQIADGHLFGTDALLLAAFARSCSRDGMAAELGGGSGVVSLLLASEGAFEKIYCVEIQEDYVGLIGKNAEHNGLSEKVIPIAGDIRAIAAGCMPVGMEGLAGKFDAVFSNPPYMKANAGRVSERGHKDIARREVLCGIGDVCAAAARLLRPGGSLCLVWRPARLAPLMAALAAARLAPKLMRSVHAAAGAEASLVLVAATLGGGEQMTLASPVLLDSGKSYDELF